MTVEAKTMTDLEELKKLAEAATPGPWTVSGVSMNTGNISIGMKDLRIVIAEVTNAASFGDMLAGAMRRGGGGFEQSDCRTQFANADLIAAARSALPALIERVEAAESERDAAILRLKTYEEVDAELNAKFVNISDANAQEATARAEAAEAENARLREMVERFCNIMQHCSVTYGSCCCGEDMANHSEYSGHAPTDHGSYVADQALEDALALLGRQS